MIWVAILIGSLPPIGIVALWIYIFIKDHSALAESIYLKATLVALVIALVCSPVSLIASALFGVELSTAEIISFCMFTLIDIAIGVVILCSNLRQKHYHKKMERMNMIPVNATAISHIGYKDNTLYVRMNFGGGRIYSYPQVPKNVYEKLEHAVSIDCYFADHIRGKYECIEL